jgi:thymidine kinase
MSARLELIVGPMFSGKTERLLVKLARAQYAKKRILVIKPAIDTRTDTFILEVSKQSLFTTMSNYVQRFIQMNLMCSL